MEYRTLISTDALEAHLRDGWVIVDCRFDLKDEEWGIAQYRAGHVPGAVYASLARDLSAASTDGKGRHPLPDPQEMAARFGRLGIGSARQVIAYDQDTGMFASRLWWMLRYLGHTNVAVLDGGWSKWRDESRPVSSDVPSIAATAFAGRRNQAAHVDVAGVEQVVATGSALLVDARASERFEGRSEPLDRAAGHIPGAVNRPYRLNVGDGGTMRSPAELREQFSQLLGTRRPEEVVMYCGSGVSACHNLLAMEHAGLTSARLFSGSWSEWSSDPTRPVETGPATRT